MDARHDSEIKLTTGSRRISASHAETKQGYSASGKPHAQTVGGLNAETRIGGIEPMGKISLLTFLFIGLPGCSTSQNWTRSPIVITRGPPMVPVTEPKLAPLFGQPLEMVALVQDSVPTGRVVGIVVDLPEPL